ncbi:hypothetical protein BRADI_2g50532v3 [Brachypodium distachyon]|uniref:Uncharacterized protein n=1 Tax=Brachypodium distachyon TaxID=15368 RepID=I1HRT8_BRADI|nr:hypothetical protein BRADI_2g50532v3 [Brachypodium distachyon]
MFPVQVRIIRSIKNSPAGTLRTFSVPDSYSVRVGCYVRIIFHEKQLARHCEVVCVQKFNLLSTHKNPHTTKILELVLFRQEL